MSGTKRKRIKRKNNDDGSPNDTNSNNAQKPAPRKKNYHHKKSGPRTRTLPEIEEKAPNVYGSGRPTKLTGAKLKQIETVCKISINPTYAFIAKVIEVKEVTFHDWLNSYKDLREKIDAWRAESMVNLRAKAYSMAAKGDKTMMKFILDRRDPEFQRSKKDEESEDIQPNHGPQLPPPRFL